jgi:glycerol dehydrogenase-like iron-containing ADH family enzyme
MSSSEREKPEQIPNEQNIEETKAMVNEQGRVSGERKQVDVQDYPKAAAIGQILKDLEFPADKNKIIEYAERARPQGEEILSDLKKIKEKQYNNVAEVTKATGIVRQ